MRFIKIIITFSLLCIFFQFRLANISPGEVVIDPMCGGGSISIEVFTYSMQQCH